MPFDLKSLPVPAVAIMPKPRSLSFLAIVTALALSESLTLIKTSSPSGREGEAGREGETQGRSRQGQRKGRRKQEDRKPKKKKKEQDRESCALGDR